MEQESQGGPKQAGEETRVGWDSGRNLQKKLHRGAASTDLETSTSNLRRTKRGKKEGGKRRTQIGIGKAGLY